MNSIENACMEMEGPAADLGGLVKECQTLVRKVQKAVQTGNVRVLTRTLADLVDAVGRLQGTANNAKDAWPHTSEEVAEYLRGSWMEELMAEGRDREMEMFPLPSGDALIAPPLSIRVMPESLSVYVGQKRAEGIRPSFLADTVRKAQDRDPQFDPAGFLNRLYKMFCGILGRVNLRHDDIGVEVVQLERLYRLYTEYPGVRRTYSRLDFARDLFLLDSSDTTLQRTISSRPVRLTAAFPSATGTRSGNSKVFSYIREDGALVDYYGLRFDEVESESDCS